MIEINKQFFFLPKFDLILRNKSIFYRFLFFLAVLEIPFSPHYFLTILAISVFTFYLQPKDLKTNTGVSNTNWSGGRTGSKKIGGPHQSHLKYLWAALFDLFLNRHTIQKQMGFCLITIVLFINEQ